MAAMLAFSRLPLWLIYLAHVCPVVMQAVAALPVQERRWALVLCAVSFFVLYRLAAKQWRADCPCALPVCW